MSLYDLPHIVVGIVYLLFGALGGFYALRTLIMLYKSPEMLRTQQRIWLPILVGIVFFTVGGFLHIAEHSSYGSPEIELLHEIFVVMGLAAFVIGVLRYSQLQMNYYSLKREGLKRVQFEEPLQRKPQQLA